MTAGTVNYETGEICFGPINIVGTGINTPSPNILDISDVISGVGLITDPTLLPTGLSLPVVFIPANDSTIPATTPGTIINVISPEITVASLGTNPPPTIPLNSLTPTVFNQTPVLVELTPLDNNGSLDTTGCF